MEKAIPATSRRTLIILNITVPVAMRTQGLPSCSQMPRLSLTALHPALRPMRANVGPSSTDRVIKMAHSITGHALGQVSVSAPSSQAIGTGKAEGGSTSTEPPSTSWPARRQDDDIQSIYFSEVRPYMSTLPLACWLSATGLPQGRSHQPFCDSDFIHSSLFAFTLTLIHRPPSAHVCTSLEAAWRLTTWAKLRL